MLLGDPKFRKTYGSDARLRLSSRRVEADGPVALARAAAALRQPARNPVGLRHKGEHLIKAMCPPYYDTMADAVDAVVADKFGPDGIYTDEELFARHLQGRFRRAATSPRRATTPPT